MVIVYRSDTGFTEEYAQMLGKAEKLRAVPLEEAKTSLEAGAEVLYMGPLMAGHIKGLDPAVKRFSVKAVCAVGMSPPAAVSEQALRKANYVPDAPIFYLQGGYLPEKKGWLTRRMVNMVTRSMRQALQDKGGRRTAEEQKLLDMFIKGGSFVAFQNLAQVRAWLAGRSGSNRQKS